MVLLAIVASVFLEEADDFDFAAVRVRVHRGHVVQVELLVRRVGKLNARVKRENHAQHALGVCVIH
jgi:hypothetical protein